MGQSSQPHELGGGLKSRHVTMLSIAGVIGASLFVGSSVAIAEAGPAVLLAYLFAGLLVVMIMRMLAEMAVATPDTGSFSTYADKAIGRWAGYTIGWLYWWFWVLVIPLEANIAAMILHSWVPGIPIWLFSLVITLALTGSNLLSVKNYGEFEFWLALCKVIAILAFIFLGAVAISGFYPYAEVSGISRLWDSGGFMPNGFGIKRDVDHHVLVYGRRNCHHCRRGIRHAGKTYCPRHQLGYLAYFYLLFMFYFCRRGINSVEYARTKSRRFLSLGTGIAQYSPCEINHGLRDITFRNQLPELGAVYRVKDALLLKPSR